MALVGGARLAAGSEWSSARERLKETLACPHSVAVSEEKFEVMCADL